MYNNQKRVELVKRRIYERNCQQQRHGIYGRSAACMVFICLSCRNASCGGRTYTDGGSGHVRFWPAISDYGQGTWVKGSEKKECIIGKGGQKR